MNAVHLIGCVSDYRPKISWTEAGKGQCGFTLIVEEAARDGVSYRTVVPVLLVGPQAEHWAETLEPQDLVAVSGKLQYKAGKSKDAGKLVVVTYAVERLATPTRAVESHT